MFGIITNFYHEYKSETLVLEKELKSICRIRNEVSNMQKT